MRVKNQRAGSALIEVVLALVVLAISGTALITLVGQTTYSIASLQRSERETRDASVQLAALATLDRSQLIERAGHSERRGQWSVQVTRVTADLFDVAVSALDTSSVLLRTTLYRKDSTHAARP